MPCIPVAPRKRDAFESPFYADEFGLFGKGPSDPDFAKMNVFAISTAECEAENPIDVSAPEIGENIPLGQEKANSDRYLLALSPNKAERADFAHAG